MTAKVILFCGAIKLKGGSRGEEKGYSKLAGEQFAVGGVEPPPGIGHLSGGEPIVKPTQKGRFFYFAEEGGDS